MHESTSLREQQIISKLQKNMTINKENKCSLKNEYSNQCGTIGIKNTQMVGNFEKEARYDTSK